VGGDPKLESREEGRCGVVASVDGELNIFTRRPVLPLRDRAVCCTK
jgi:hypothetical protein